jgi:hypothetical protein
MMMRSLMTALIAALWVNALCAQTAQPSPVGRWTVFDDDTGKPDAIIEIERQEDALYGWIDRVLGEPADANPPRCTRCEGELKNAPLIGLKFIQAMKPEGDAWRGRILDPKSGKVYNATMSLAEQGRKLEVRGYIGLPLFGRSQTWERAD